MPRLSFETGRAIGAAADEIRPSLRYVAAILDVLRDLDEPEPGPVEDEILAEISYVLSRATFAVGPPE